MHLGKFHNILWQLRNDEKHTNLVVNLEALTGALAQLAASPTTESYAVAYKAALEQFRVFALKTKFAKPTPIEASYLLELDASQYIGINLFNKVTEVIAKNQMAVTIAAAELRNLYMEVKEYYDSIETIDELFSKLKIEFERNDPGRAEIAVAVPFEHGTKTLKDLSKETNEWHNALHPISEVFDPANAEIKLDFMSSSDWQFYLIATPMVIFGVSATLKSLNGILTEIIKMRVLIKQLIGTGVSDNFKDVATAEMNGKLKTDIRNLAEKIVDENYKSEDLGRKNELKNALSQSINFIAKKMVAGTTVEVKLIPHEAPNTEGDSPEEAAVKDDLHRQEIALAESVKQNMELIELMMDGNAPLGIEFEEDEQLT